MARRECIIVGCLDRLEDEYFTRIPRHVTIVPWFSIDEDKIAKLSAAINVIVATYSRMQVTGGEQAQYGLAGEVSVRLLKETTELRALHDELLQLVKDYEVNLRAPHYTGENYSPHVSKWSEAWLDNDETVTLSAIQLIESVNMGALQRRLLANFPFGEVV